MSSQGPVRSCWPWQMSPGTCGKRLHSITPRASLGGCRTKSHGLAPHSRTAGQPSGLPCPAPSSGCPFDGGGCTPHPTVEPPQEAGTSPNGVLCSGPAAPWAGGDVVLGPQIRRGAGWGPAFPACSLQGDGAITDENDNADRPWAAWASELEDHNCGNSDFPFVDTEIVRDRLYQLNVCKSAWPDGSHPRVPKELADVAAGLLSITYQRSWESGEVPAARKLVSVFPVFKKGMREDPGNYRPVSLTSVPGEMMGKIILAAVERH